VNAPPLIEARALTKTFPGVTALDRVHFELRAGEVHALLGENGAGKSTLTRIIAGDYQPDAGELYFSGEKVALGSPREARARGVRLVTQERTLVPTLSVAENIFLGRLPKRSRTVVDWRVARRGAEEVLARIGLEVDPATEVGLLRPAEQQLVEIARELSDAGRILVLDEPTAALASAEADRLFDVVRSLQEQGVGILYISHRVGELADIASRVTVLRDGRVVTTRELTATNTDELVRLMIGRELSDLYQRTATSPGDVALELSDVSVEGICQDVSLTVRLGEIVAVFGLVGSGATEIPYIAAGHLRHSGSVVTSGRVGIVPLDRRHEGLLRQATTRRNIGAGSLDRYARFGIFSRRRERAAASRQIVALGIRPPRPEARVAGLSGGNQQKVVLARSLEAGAGLLLLAEPTRGVDVGARADIYGILRGLCERGAAVLMASSDLDEVVGLAGRVYVMARGRVVDVFADEAITRARVLEAAAR
jgi:ABC-type sugar transport system ATPase subunit